MNKIIWLRNIFLQKINK